MATGDPSQVFGTITSNLLPSGSVILSVLVVMFFMVCAGVFLFVLATKHRWPIKYRAVIFERVGNFLRPKFKTQVIFKRKRGQEGYYIDKRKMALSIADAVPDDKNRPIFFLMKVEDRYVPVNFSSMIPAVMKDDKGKDVVTYLPSLMPVIERDAEDHDFTNFVPSLSFVPFVHLNEYEDAMSQTLLADAKKYKWMDKLAPLIMIGVPMIILLISFFLTAWSVKGQQANLAELQTANAKQDAVVSKLGELVEQMSESNTLVAKYLGEVRETVPSAPPG